MASVTIDGNEAAARVAYRLSEVVAVYPITPASPMGEAADAWATEGRPNLWGDVPEVVELQSEGGAAGAIHGALQAGALATTFTASQGLLLMLPNMFKIGGELTPAVFHVAARAIATHALSIFGDHSDVMAARGTGWAMLCSSSVQEAHDLALVAHAATLRTRLPFLHFFDGFRTSHELNVVELLDDDDLHALVADELVSEHRARGLSPEHPQLRGTAQNPDTFFQAREAASPYYDRAPEVVQQTFDELAARTGRQYHLFDYHGAPDADRVVVVMGSASATVREAVDDLVGRGERVGAVTVRLFRPFSADALDAAIPPTARAVAVLDRTKEPGSVGEPLLQDVATTLVGAVGAGARAALPRVVGGRYGLGSKEFTPAHARAVLAELTDTAPRARFTVGIVDDVSGSSLEPAAEPTERRAGVTAAVFYGLGSDGTVGANKSSVKILTKESGRFAQGYFVYDSKKAGAVTVSHLRFGDAPIDAPYLIDEADFVAVHQFPLLERMDVLAPARDGATILLNSPFGPDATWDRLPREVQQQILDRNLRVHVIDAHRLTRDVGLAGYVSTVLQTCFFELAGLLPRDRAANAIKAAIRETYGMLGDAVIGPNDAAVDAALDHLHALDPTRRIADGRPRGEPVPDDAPEFVRRVTAQMLAGRGDLLPVSAFPVDGTFPVGTARYEKRGIAASIPVWDPELCIDCGKCSIVCPHATIRTSIFDPATFDPPDDFLHKPAKDKDAVGMRYVVQVAPDDCTGCGMCVEVCPAHSKEAVRRRAIEMAPREEHAARERARFETFLTIPEPATAIAKATTVRGTQLRTPLFEFSGACAGCGETPYLKLLTQLFGDRVLVANATGCSSIYGGNLPTTPWSAGADGRGPAWSNSLFEDNAEFGLGMRLGLDARRDTALRLARQLAADLGSDLVDGLTADATVESTDEDALASQRARVTELRSRLADLSGPDAATLLDLADDLVPRAVWIVGGDGWAYDIGFGGLDHVLASGRDVNVLVLDTECYSNTGGQASKATPRGAVAKFASGGQATRKKDLGMLAAAYGNVYVAQVAMGANDLQTVKAFNEAASHRGPSLIIAYSHCVAHGIDMAQGMAHQRDAVKSGGWPLYRYDPRHARRGDHPFRLDSRTPSIPYREYARTEARFTVLERTDPDAAAELGALAQHDVDERWNFYSQLGELERWSEDDRHEPGHRDEEATP